MNPKHIIITTAIILLMCGTASAWLSGYDHRMAITVENLEASPLTDYQFNFTNDTNVLVAAGHMQASGADCRVTDASDNLIPFWNETAFNAAGTKIWANATLEVGSNMFYMYYGDATALDVSDISATFDFGDDFTENTLPSSITTLSSWSKNRASYIVGDILYLTHYQGLSTYSISDPTTPIFLSTHTFGTYVLDIVVDGNYAYCSDSSEDRIWVIDVTDPSAMSTTGTVQDATYLDFAHGVAKTGDYIICCAYLAHALTIVDVSIPSAPNVVGHVVDAVKLKWIHDIVLDGDNAFVACHGSANSNGGTIACVNISNKNSPVITSSLADTALCHASDIQKKGDYCFVGCWEGSSTCGGSGCSIQVVDVSNPSSMTIVESLAGSRGYILDIHGDYLYSANGEGIYTTYPIDKIDITDPLNIALVHRYNLPSGTAFRHVLVTPDGNYLIVADHTEPSVTAPFYIISESSEKWDDISGTPVINAGNLELQQGDCVYASGFSQQYCRCKFRAKKSSTSSGLARIGMSNAVVSSGFYSDDAVLFYKFSANDIKAGSSNEGALEVLDTGINYAANVFQTYEILWKSGEVKVLVDDVFGGTYTTYVPDEALNPRAEVEVSSATEYIDWYFIGKYVAIEPTSSLGAEEDAPAGNNDIVLAANQHGMLRKDVTAAQTFSTIAAGIDHDRCYTWWDSTADRWESYRVGYSYNADESVPEHDSYFVLMDGTGTTIVCSIAAAETVAIPSGWYATYLRESDAKTLSAIKTDMGGNVADLYAFDPTTGAWTDTGTYSVLPNQGLMIGSSAGFDWDGTVP